MNSQNNATKGERIRRHPRRQAALCAFGQVGLRARSSACDVGASPALAKLGPSFWPSRAQMVFPLARRVWPGLMAMWPMLASFCGMAWTVPTYRISESSLVPAPSTVNRNVAQHPPGSDFDGMLLFWRGVSRDPNSTSPADLADVGLLAKSPHKKWKLTEHQALRHRRLRAIFRLTETSGRPQATQRSGMPCRHLRGPRRRAVRLGLMRRRTGRWRPPHTLLSGL